MEGIITLVVLGIIIFLFVLPSRKLGPPQSLSSLSGTTNSGTVTVHNSSSQSSSGSPTPTSLYKELGLSTGNASYAYQPHEEYITLYNSGQNPIDISGWTLQNGRGSRAYDVGGGNLQYFPSITALIPKGVGFVSPLGQNYFQDIVLKPGENAIIVTGSVGSTGSPFPIVSFKENECSGYLQNLPDYSFSPYLNMTCVSPSQEPGLEALDSACQHFVSTLSSCQTPKFNTTRDGYAADYRGNTCVGCVNGTPGLSNACVAFIKTHFSYQGCLAYHSGDPNFYSNTWRIYLNKPWEMWATDHESISLFDLRGNLAAFTHY